ncbi:MAG TPA: sulfite exporter TauE/SafE family protein [Xanthobacteraceae bacterium]|nr:sulfite exporter TauE/SafE family protein [Xanthobacteraceae bacterium]
MITVIVLIGAGILAGALNSLAGGGSLVTFPALLFAGLNPIDANASSVVALFPATFASVWAFRRHIRDVAEVNVTALSIVSLLGGVAGALLLLSTPTSVFAALVPWLVLISTIIFAVGNFAPLDVVRRLALGPRGALAAHFIVSVYGGYFGGGIGFLLLAALTLFGMRDINAMNGLKMWLVGIMTAASILIFVVADVIRWPEVLPMSVGAVIGGYAAAHVAQRLDQRMVKYFIIVWGVTVTAYFFWMGV